DVLDPRGFYVDRIVERQRPIEQAAGDLPAIGHLAKRRSLDSGRDLGDDGLYRRQNGYSGKRAEAGMSEQVDSVLNDVALAIEIREDVDGSVGDEDGLGI